MGVTAFFSRHMIKAVLVFERPLRRANPALTPMLPTVRLFCYSADIDLYLSYELKHVRCQKVKPISVGYSMT